MTPLGRRSTGRLFGVLAPIVAVLAFCLPGAAVCADEPADAFTQLEQLLRIAPNRALGVAGNQAIDDYIQSQFKAIVDRQNKRIDASRHATANDLLGKVAELNERIARARMTQYLPAASAEGPSLDSIARDAYAADLDAAAALTGLWQAGRMSFPAAVFVPGEAYLTVAGGERVRIRQLAPNLVEPANLPDGTFSGNMVYARTGLPAELSVDADDKSGRARLDFEGAAALIEFESSNRWVDMVQLGAKAVIVLEPEAGREASLTEAMKKQSLSPISVPRFYLTREDLHRALGENWKARIGSGVPVTITQKPGVWRSRELAIDWLFIPGSAPAEDEVSRELVHLQAYKDSDSIVPELSPGATNAANIVLLMRTIQKYEQNLPRRPVLVSVVNGHTHATLGETEYVFAAFADPAAMALEMDWAEREQARQRFISELYGEGLSEAMIERIRTETTTVAGQSFKLNKSVLDRLRLRRNRVRARMISLTMQVDDIEKGRTRMVDAAESEELIARSKTQIAEYDDRIDALNRFMGLFNRFGRVTKFKDLSETDRSEIASVFAEIARDAAEQASLLGDHRRRLVANMAVRRQLRTLIGAATAADVADANADAVFVRRHPELPVIAAFTLDLSFGTNQVGFFPVDQLVSATTDGDAINRVSRLSRHTLTIADAYAATTGRENLLVDTVRNVGGVPWRAHLGTRMAMGARPFHSLVRPAMTLTGVRDSRSREYTPHDTADRINRANFDAVMTFAEGYLPMLIDGDGLAQAKRTVGRSDPVTVAVSVRLQDQFTVGLPQEPLANGLVVPVSARLGSSTDTMAGQVRLWPVVMTDARGDAILRGSGWRSANIMAFKYDENYSRMVGAIDLGFEAKYSSTISEVKSNDTFKTKIVVAFNCRKVDLVGLTQPTNLMPVAAVTVLDALQDSRPRSFGVAGVQALTKRYPTSGDGTASLMMEEGSRFKLFAGQSLVINADEKNPQGIGFPISAGLLPDLVSTSARDMWLLTNDRLKKLEAKGVVSETSRTFNDEAGEKVQAALEGRQHGRYDLALIDAEEARGLAFWAYISARGTINDLIRAAVIFLALVIPFCFFLMKLITPFTDINRQLMTFTAIFALMAMLLWALHPAFKVAETPLVVILGFVIMGLAMFVSSIVMSRFNSSMNQAVEQMQQSESVEAPQSRLAGVAFMVGVNNMKRRRIRTTLTCATIVLVTFTMLSVISVGQDVEPSRVRMGSDPTYTGFLYTRPGLGAMNEMQLRRLQAHFQQGARTVSRSWNQRLGEFGDYLDYEIRVASESGATSSSQVLKSKVLLGLEVGEVDFLGRMPLLPGSRWFSSNNAPEIVLSVKAAEILGMSPENFLDREVFLHGRKLTVVGLVDDESVQAMKDLGDIPLLPILRAASQSASEMRAREGESARAMTAELSGSAVLEAGSDLLSQPGVEVARAIDIVMLPIEFAQSLGEATIHTLSVKYEGDDEAASRRAWHDANRLIRFQFARIDLGLGSNVPLESGRSIQAGQYALASSSATRIGGILKVAIPIILTATIIFNTMLGSVMERRREVSIYNAIGLNPGHVMTFFLAESMVFGLVGSVAGYLIGQALSLFITHFGLIDLNLNYSSTSVMVVIFLTIVTVLLSTVYPAMMAARAAVPSGQRRWSLPQPKNDEIHVEFPFIYDANRVLGVCAYLRDYMLQHSEASTGSFLARVGPVGRVDMKAADAEKAYVMLFDVAPAPFDLGVNQQMEVYAYFDQHVKAHMLSIHLTRTSGEINNWMAVNQPFLESLRKRLLGWRSQRRETHESFYRQGEALFSGAQDMPTQSADADHRGGTR